MIHIRDTFDTSRETGNQAPCSHIRYCSESSLFTITKWKEICFPSPAPCPLRVAIFTDFVLLYKKVYIKMCDKLTGNHGIFLMTITALCGAWPPIKRESGLLKCFCFEALRLSTSLKKNASTGIFGILLGKLWKGGTPAVFLVRRWDVQPGGHAGPRGCRRLGDP